MSIDEVVKVVKARGDATFGEGASAAEVKQAEDQLGVKFPAVFADYLRRFGWLTVGSEEFYGLGTDVPSHLSLVENVVWEREQSGCPVPLHLIPIYNDGAGNIVCVDVDNRSGRVVFWDHEQGRNQVAEELAASLDAWLAEQIAALDEANVQPAADLRAFLAEMPSSAPSESEIDRAIARYVERTSGASREQLLRTLMEVVSAHDTDDSLQQTLLRDFGYRFDAQAVREPAGRWMALIAVRVLS